MTTPSRRGAILSTLFICLAASLLNAVMKLFYGYASGSLAFVADGLHSVFDSLSTILGIFSIALSSKPPDADHPYGHQKFETLSAMVLGLLLFIVAYEVGLLAFKRLSEPQAQPIYTYWGAVILAVTMMINLGISRFEKKKALQLKSSFLAADSIHNQSDFLITCTVLVTYISAQFNVLYIDAIASFVIALYLVFLAIRLTWFNFNPLVDRSVLDSKAVEKIVEAVPGVVHCHQVRSRGESGHHFLDLRIHLPGNISLIKAHEITHEVEHKLRDAFPGLVDVVIHTEPDGHPPCC